jgi:phosphoenolpyruvate-protein phosphotransferase (PTS system enzyme I)
MVLARSDNLVMQGIAASPGIAIGRALVADRAKVEVSETGILPEDVPGEVKKFLDAIGKVRDDLHLIKSQIEAERGAEHLYVLDTHLLILEDSMLTTDTVVRIESEHINAEGSLKRTLVKFREFFDAIEDEYFRERVGDIEIVGERILRRMTGTSQEPLQYIDGKVIIVAHDLSPADVLQIDKSRVIGLVTDLGGKTSHTSILARALGIPAVVGLEGATSSLLAGDHLVIDGATGTVVVNPDHTAFRDLLARKQYYEYCERELSKLKDLSSETVDGHRITLKGNLEFLEEVDSLHDHGGAGVGLYRTEMLFMNRIDLPDEDEQFETYKMMLEKVAPYPVSIRTLDVGGDKFVPELNLKDELNPALGLRAIRLSLRNPETFRPQLRAILRASAYGEARIFFPMISGVAEIREVKRSLQEIKSELDAEGLLYDKNLKIGIMIEIPSAVLTADLLAREVDFFSVGTNDLIQYSLAIDRTNEHLSHLYEPLHPAILRSLKMVVDAAHAAGIDACICGEMAGDPFFLPILLGLGFDELSMSPPSILRVKQILRRCSLAETEVLVSKALEFATAKEVESYLKSEIAAHFSDSFD